MTITLRRALCLGLLLASMLVLPISCFCADGSTSRWIVVYKNSTARMMSVQSSGANVRHNYGVIPGYSADLTADQVGTLKSDPSVAYVQPDIVRHTMQAAPYSSTALYSPAYSASTQIIPYGISLVHAPDVWPYSKGAGVKVAHIDTGIDLTHPDVPSIVASRTFTSHAVQDTDGHGTHTSGTIAAPGNSGGVVGVAPQAGLLVAQVFDLTGNAYDSDIIAGIDWAVSNGAKVISMSLGGTTYDSALDDACASAVASGAVVIAAAGNDGTSAVNYPAAYSSVISVAAVDQSKQRASFSNYGSTVDLCAPGIGVTSSALVGTGWLTSANWNGIEHETGTMDGSANGTVTAPAVYCGLGNPSDFPSSVRGKIAHIRRGTLTFEQKVDNAIAAGAVGVIVSNNVPDVLQGALDGPTSVVVVPVSQANGDDLAASDGTTVTISNTKPADYRQMDGTSMATPHVAGVAALLIGARHGQITPSELTSALENSAEDLGSPGRDDYYGYGLVNASAALARVIPVVQSVSASPAQVAPGASVTVKVQLSTVTGLSSVAANGVALAGNGTLYTGAISADSSPGAHSVDVVVSDTYGNITHNTSAGYTTNALPLPTISVSAPSRPSTTSGPVSFIVAYSNATAISLGAADVTLNALGTATGSVSVTGSATTARTVTISNITGNGTLGISIAAGTASNASGTASAAGPSATFAVTPAPLSIAFTFPTTGLPCTRNSGQLSISGTTSGGSGVASVSYSLNGGPAGICTGTTSWSATGITLSPGPNTLSVTATDTQNSTAAATISITYTNAQPGDTWQGTAMVSLPIVPDTSDPKPMVGFDQHKWFAYNAAGGAYLGYSDQQSWFQPAANTPGRGFWAYFTASGAGYPTGNIPSQTQPKTIHLYPGWNLIGNPFINSVPWNTSAITVLRTGATTPVALRSSSDAVLGFAWGWDSVKRSYYLVVDPTQAPNQVSALQPWRAYWLRAYAECDLILPPP